ncbi:MAG: glycerol-3-phosphate acyltransferase, partial [Candidatus Krumholzibacteriota bacterium]|nr:glycerol-3-phosphate acyltransferase [Candidatus Krumholzibacteriota bacterium]
MEPGTLILAIVLAVLIGGIPSGLLVARHLSDLDLRSVGSGNIGATN